MSLKDFESNQDTDGRMEARRYPALILLHRGI